ncbi:MAG: class I SAM-dependent methyltransferase [Chitinophagales bacterium]|nr:class I SAM-dependent methyltransferase [Chitinophagales bacterium]
MSWITVEDFRDVYIKALQRGVDFIGSKVTLDQRERTKSAFNSTTIETGNWWIIPYVKRRWNEKITGSADVSYEQYLSDNYFQHEDKIKMLSMGSGICSHEILLAEINPHWSITCVDISDSLIDRARGIAQDKGLHNIEFKAADIYEEEFKEGTYDLVFFHSALHHFDEIDKFIERKVERTLRSGGKVVINEYVGPNRMQYPSKQIAAINEALKLIDKPYRQIFKTSLFKNRYYGSGKLRMQIADPSECVDSESILPVLRSRFKVVEEKPYGGSILMSVLKDISHHFTELNERKRNILDSLFSYEDAYIERNSSDFMFAVYEKP